jgi:hypothetical protein
LDDKTIAKYKDKCRLIITKISSNHEQLSPNFGKIDEIFGHYEVYKKHIHKNMKCDDVDAKTEPLMDNHKIAAAFFCSFLKARPINYTPASAHPPNGFELMANEHGAFLFGLQVVQDFWADRYFDCKHPEEKEIYKEIIRFPETGSDHYIHWFIKLATDGIENYFDFQNEKYEEKLIFFIAHIYFMIESYSFQFYRAKLYESRTEILARELNTLKK